MKIPLIYHLYSLPSGGNHLYNPDPTFYGNQKQPLILVMLDTSVFATEITMDPNRQAMERRVSDTVEAKNMRRFVVC